MTQEFFFGNYLAYPRCIKVAVGLEIDLDFNNNPQPVGPPNDEIWYTTTDDEIYDLSGIIEMLVSMGGTYNGPAVISNEYNEEKEMWCITFDDDVTILGNVDIDTMTAEGPLFVSNPEYEVSCNVETIVLPKTVNTIGSYAFTRCAGLTSLTIPNSVTSIGYGAFVGCTGLTSITIPNSVTSIGDWAFLLCYGLTSVTIGNSVTSIGYGAFAQCTGLTSVTIPNSVISIGNLAFSGCNGLTSVTIPDSVTSIGAEAFVNCTGLTSITIPNSVTSIGDYAFWGCSSLTSMTIGNNVTSIGMDTFNGCSSLTSVTIPDSVTSIGAEAFVNCTGLTSMTCEATAPPTLNGSFVFDNTNNCPIYVPTNSVEAYKAAENWSTYADRIQAIQ